MIEIDGIQLLGCGEQSKDATGSCAPSDASHPKLIHLNFDLSSCFSLIKLILVVVVAVVVAVADE